LAHRTAVCDDELKNYINERNKRNKERDLVAKVIQLVNRRLATLRNYLKKRME